MKNNVDSTVIQEKLMNLSTVLHQYEDTRTKSNQNLSNISKTHERIQNEKKNPGAYKKLKQLYNTAIHDSENEEIILKEALNVIGCIQNEKKVLLQNADDSNKATHQETLMVLLQHCGQTLPLWIGNQGESAPPLCGAIPAGPNYAAKAHDMVAAKVGAKGEEMWIVAEVSHYNVSTGKYVVNDIDGEKKDQHVLSKKEVIPLPLMRANPETNPEALFPKDKSVLAIYPQATCFYPAIVKEPPLKPTDDYQLLFEDSQLPGGIDTTPISVCQKYVISFEKGNT